MPCPHGYNDREVCEECSADLKERLAVTRTGNLRGVVFGKLTVVNMAPRSEWRTRNSEWDCVCQCGLMTRKRAYSLLCGDVKNCGINSGCRKRGGTGGGRKRSANMRNGKLNRCDLSGRRFGRLLVFQVDSERLSSRGFWWKCRCDCGAWVVVIGKQLKSGETKSCGCLRSEMGVGAARRNFWKADLATECQLAIMRTALEDRR